jgi:hypothetical protein
MLISYISLAIILLTILTIYAFIIGFIDSHDSIETIKKKYNINDVDLNNEPFENMLDNPFSNEESTSPIYNIINKNENCPFGGDPEVLETSRDMLNCVKRVWSATDPKGWTCAAPMPTSTSELAFKSDSNVKYHDTIEDIKAQNPDMQLNLITKTYTDVNGNTLEYKKAEQQNNIKYSGIGKYKYGYNNYVPTYRESVILSKLTDDAQKQLNEDEEKLNEEYNLFNNIKRAYNNENYQYVNKIETLPNVDIQNNNYSNYDNLIYNIKNRGIYLDNDIMDRDKKQDVIWANANYKF